MQAAKLFRYCGNELGTSVMFVLFTLSWVLCRLLYLPLGVLRSVIYDAYHLASALFVFGASSFCVFETRLTNLGTPPPAVFIFLSVISIYKIETQQVPKFAPCYSPALRHVFFLSFRFKFY